MTGGQPDADRRALALPARGPAGLAYRRLLLLALVTVAVLPVATLGLVVWRPVQAAIEADARTRVDRSEAAASALLSRLEDELDGLTRSYADWPTLASLVSTGDLESIRRDVLGFLVGQGSIDDAILLTGGQHVGAYRQDQTADVIAGMATPSFVGRSYVPLGDGLYAASVAAVGRTSAKLVFLRRLDARFATDVVHLTGFDVDLVDGADRPILSTRAPAGQSAAAASAVGDRALATGDVTLRTTSGEVYRLVLSADLSSLELADGSLPSILLAVLAATTAGAFFLAVLLARLLRRRLDYLHDGLAAIADGRLPPARGARRVDDIARVEAGLDRLVRALDRREAVLQRSLGFAASVSTELPPADLAGRAARAAADILGLAACRIVGDDGILLGEAATDETASVGFDSGPGLTVEAPLELAARDRLRLVGTLSPRARWTAADQDQLEVIALLIGMLLRDAGLYRKALDRTERIAQINRLQREFMRAVSHALQSPLTIIGLAVDDLVEGTGGDEFLHRRALIARAESRRLARQIAEILTRSRLDAGTVSVEPEAVSAIQLARGIWAELGAERRLEVDRSDERLVIADRAALAQVLAILLDNANRYAPSGRVRLSVERVDGAQQRILVEDEGPGIPPADRMRVFRPFWRGSTSTAGPGIGLGLSVARGLARAMGGDLRCVAGSLAGAAFALILPVAAEEPAPVRAPSSGRAQPRASRRRPSAARTTD